MNTLERRSDPVWAGPDRRVVAKKVRVYELARELEVESKVVLAKLSDLGEFVKSPSSTIEAPVVRKLREAFPAPEVKKPDEKSGANKDSAAKSAAKKSTANKADDKPAPARKAAAKKTEASPATQAASPDR